MYRYRFILVRCYFIIVALLLIPVAASLAFSSYPMDAEIGQVYTVSWVETSGPVRYALRF